MITNEPYEGQREPSCIHSQGTQPAGMCVTCRDDPAYIAWLERGRAIGLHLNATDRDPA